MLATKTLPIDSEEAAKPVIEGGKSPILVVDDSIVSQRLAGGLIQHGIGHPVIYANDGNEAVSLLELIEPCVVLTDIHMPNMDGFELVEEIRTNHPQIPVILMTAYGSEAVAWRALTAGAANYVPKDHLVTDLVDTLRQILTVVEGNKRRRRLLTCQTARAGTFELGNDPDLFPALIALIQEELLSFSIGDETSRMRVAIALQESLANALYHGNLECSSDLRQEDERHFYDLADQRRAIDPYRSRRINLLTRIDRNELRVDIRDDGPGFDVGGLDKACDPEDLTRVGGRGMILIRTFMDEVIHNDTGNQITLIKRNGS
jgi:CheY-like chemotaxis protein/anti-sigma regulatory factor (Ser/Thr protein kinase)